MLLKTWGRSAVVVALIAAVAVSGCSLIHKKKPTLAYQERPVELLFNTGADYLDRRRWNDAVNYFHEVERQHPYSEWARRAILMGAYAHYEANDYADAMGDADRFIALYPGNAATPYAFYLKAICYFEQIVDVGRDQASTQNAQVALGEVIKRYPGTEYATDARFKLDMVHDQLAGKEMTIGRFYLRGGDPIAAIGRFRTVIDKYQTTSHTPEALYRLVEVYLTIGLPKEAVANGAVLGFNYPGDIWYRDAYRLLTSRNLRPATAPTQLYSPGLLPHFGRHKETTVSPPAYDVATGQVTQASTSDATTPALPAPGTPANPAKKPVKPKNEFLHGVLGL